MPRLNIRIGTKLAVVGGLGLLLVGAIALNDVGDRDARTALAAEANRVAAVRTAALDAVLASRGLVTVGRDIRLAMASAEVDELLRRADGFASSATRALDTAAAAATGDAGERIAGARRLVTQYFAAVTEMAAARKDVIETQLRLGDQGLAWAKDLSELLASRELAALPNAAEVAHALERADFHNASSRAALWALLARGAVGAQGAQERFKERLANSTKFLKQARAMTDDPAMVKKIDPLLGFAPRYEETMDQTLKAAAHLAAVVRDRADKTRADLDKVLDAAAADLTARAAAIEGRIDAQEARSKAIGLALDAVVVLILLGSIAFSYIGISRPIVRLNGAMDQMGKGNLAVDVPGMRRGDEIGDMARAISVICENAARDAVQKQEEHKREESTRAEYRRSNMQRLATEFETTVGRIIETVSAAAAELEGSAATLTRSAETTQKLSVIVSDASAEASANVQSVSTATEQMTSSISEISRQVQESSRIAGEAVKHAEKTDARVTALSDAASRIGDVVNLITAIADQTNLLALNATIEAARAGSAGKGFAVVAQEVKALASQTAKATDEIGAQIKGMQAATAESVAAIKEVGDIIGRISGIGATIAAAVEQQGAATQEIVRNVHHASQGAAQVASNITNVNRGAAETGSVSAQVLASARSLASESSHLKLEMARFLETVRAA